MSSFLRKICFIKAYRGRQTDRQKDIDTDRQTDRQTDNKIENKQLSPAKKSRRGCMFFILHLLIHKINENVA